MGLRASLAFFTRLPVGRLSQEHSLEGIMAYLPAVGMAVGVCVWLFQGLFASLFPLPLAGLLTVLVWVMVTGGLHLDGAADCADALLVEASKEKRLRIMKEPTVGSFAVVALFFLLALKVFALIHVTEVFFTHATLYTFIQSGLLLCLITSMSRSMVFVASAAPYARQQQQNQGLGMAVTQNISRSIRVKNALYVAFLALCTAFSSAYFPIEGITSYSIVLACAAAFGITFFLMRVAKNTLGGVTGDVYGCIIEMGETAMLLCLCLG